MKIFKKLLILAYIVLVIYSFFFVKDALQEEKIKIKDEPEKETIFKVKPVKVTLNIDFGTYDESFDMEMKNTNTSLEILEQLRLSEEITFEVDAYTYGNKIVHINGVYPDDGQEWKAYHLENDISLIMDDVILEDKSVYNVVLTDVEE